MKASLRKALADYNLYLKKLGIDKIKKRKNRRKKKGKTSSSLTMSVK